MDSEDKTQINPNLADEPIISLRPKTVLEEFIIEEKLGQGGFGIVYLAHDTHFDVKRVIKEYFPTQLAFRDSTLTIQPISEANQEENVFRIGLDRVIEEARVLAKFEHPGIVKVHRYFEKNGTAYIVMQYVSGKSFKEYVDTQGCLTEAQLTPMLNELFSGLSMVHKGDILHRDIKPDNIIIRDDTQQAVLIDFGAARQNISKSATAATGFFSAGYTPVEQVTTSGKMGPWTDIYALAATLYFAVTGEKPVASLDRITRDNLVPAVIAGKDRASQTFLQAIDWGLEVFSENRPQNIEEWQAAFNDAEKTQLYTLQARQQAMNDATVVKTKKLHATPATKAENRSEENPAKSHLFAIVFGVAALIILSVVAAKFYFTAGSVDEVSNVSNEFASSLSDNDKANVTSSSDLLKQSRQTKNSEETAPSTSLQSNREALDFERASYIDTLESYQIFLEKYPNGSFANKAKLKIEALDRSSVDLSD